jgi:hypothetical protein
MVLGDALLDLEKAAAVVASFLDPDDEVMLQQLADAWAPLPFDGAGSSAQRARWRRQWVAWLFEAAQQWEMRPVEPSVDELHRVIVAWVCASQ